MRHLAGVMRLRRDPPPWFLELHAERAAALHRSMVDYIAAFSLSTEERHAALTREDELAWRGIAAFLHGEG